MLRSKRGLTGVAVRLRLDRLNLQHRGGSEAAGHRRLMHQLQGLPIDAGQAADPQHDPLHPLCPGHPGALQHLIP